MDILDWDESFQVGSATGITNTLVDHQMDASAPFDPIHMLSNWNLSQRQEAAAKLAAHCSAARSASVGQGWTHVMGADSGRDALNRSAYVLNPESGGLMGGDICNFTEIKAPAGSLESLDCLLSATNSNTDASVEDDGISVIFSAASADCKSLWNFNTGGNAVSSGDSACLDDTVAKTAAISDTVKCCSLGKRANTDPSDFNLISEDFQPKSKKSRVENRRPSSSNINFQQPSSSASSVEEPDSEAIAQMKEMIYRAAAFRPVSFATEVVEKPKRKNVRISTDPQTVAARQRRERISERIRVLQRLVPGGSKMDTASMLDEAANYLKFLRSQVKALEAFGQKMDSSSSSSLNFNPLISSSLPFNNYPFPMQPNFPLYSPNPLHRPT